MMAIFDRARRDWESLNHKPEYNGRKALFHFTYSNRQPAAANQAAVGMTITNCIRFNPDAYIDANGANISSCWKLNKLGVMQIAKSKQAEWESRIGALTQQIQHWVDHSSDKTVQIIELFY